MERHRYGNSEIRYGPDGRIMTGDRIPDSDTFPRRHRSLQSRRSRSAGSYDLDYRSYDAYRDDRGGRQKTDYDWDRTVRGAGGYDRPSPYDRPPQRRAVSRSPPRRNYEERYVEERYDRGGRDYARNGSIDRGRHVSRYDSYDRGRTRHDSYERSRPLPRRDSYERGRGLPRQQEEWHDHPTGYMHYDTAGLIDRPAPRKDHGYAGGRDGETRWRIRTKEKAIGWYFVIEGIVILLVAIVNMLLCVDHHFYCGFWIAFLVNNFSSLFCNFITSVVALFYSFIILLYLLYYNFIIFAVYTMLLLFKKSQGLIWYCKYTPTFRV
jgi:hypothetical protein